MNKLQQIQSALKAKGYSPGPVDNVMGTLTKAALVKFQKDNGLPIGQLDFETLKSACETVGLQCELVLEGEHYDYLAKLTLK